MPEIRHYLVQQTREVRVTASSTMDALALALAALTYGQDSAGSLREKPPGVWGDTDSRVKETSLLAHREP